MKLTLDINRPLTALAHARRSPHGEDQQAMLHLLEEKRSGGSQTDVQAMPVMPVAPPEPWKPKLVACPALSVPL
jgi:hypothetical protein